MKRLLERLQGLRRHLRAHPAEIWLCRHPVEPLDSEGSLLSGIDSPAITVGLCLFAEQTDYQRRDSGQRFAITWHEGIQIDQVSNALRHLINHAGNDHP